MGSDSFPAVGSQEDMTDIGSPAEAEGFLVGFVVVNIVGLRYYQGTISGRELLGLIREPLNPHDRNAIKVVNMRSIQVGHIERDAAALLSPLIDSGWITVEGIVPKPLGKGTRYKLPCQIHIFAKLDHIEDVRFIIEFSTLQLITESNASFTLSEAMAVKEGKASTKVKSVDEIFDSLELKINNEEALEALDPPRNIIKSELFMHQKKALGWLASRENTEQLPPFWEERNGVYVNVLTNYQTDARPGELRGGIYADDMGMGKTLTLLSLIALDKSAEDVHASPTKDAGDDREGEGATSSASDNKVKRNKGIKMGNRSRKRRRTENSNLGKSELCALDGFSLIEPRTTLIICPPSVLSAWVTQLEEHTVKGSFKLYIYYGNRTEESEELLKYDIVLTTYSTLASEMCNGKGLIESIQWRRVILDEAHLIKNPKSQLSRAVTNLNTKRRWAVTGTPVQNSSFDLFSLVSFLKFEPLSTRSLWISLIHRPLAQGNGKGASRLQVLLGTISLRRTKEKILDWLPGKTIETFLVDLGQEERQIYDELEKDVGMIVSHYISNENNVGKSYLGILGILIRLRQICNDVALCPTELRSQLSKSQIEDVENNPVLLQKLLSILQDGEDFDCPICMSPPTNSVITSCAHIFCESCIRKTLKLAKASCPLCRCTLSESDLFKSHREPVSGEASSSGISSKVSALLKLLSKSSENNPSCKSVVFSQFQKMLLLLERPLEEAGFTVIRLDGSMNTRKRGEAIQKFSVVDGPTVMLASLKASGVGINLTCASTVYLLEPWWNPAAEEQAVDRVHRIGQKEEVKIVRLITRDTIEERVLQLQEKKRLLVKKAFGGRNRRNVREINRDDLATLMNL